MNAPQNTMSEIHQLQKEISNLMTGKSMLEAFQAVKTWAIRQENQESVLDAIITMLAIQSQRSGAKQ